MAISNIQGQRFGRLVALEFSHVNQRHKAFWRFQCDCGNTVVLQPFNPAYPSQILVGEDLDHLYIAGKVVETKTKW